MAIIKCKMCGGDLNLISGEAIAECEYCYSKQTVPTADNEKMLTLFARANRLRFGCEFDKASGVYESIVAEFPEEAEAYWGLLLCKYGIEYVDDPATGKKVPTCHRSSFESVMDDGNLELACENADALARRLYRDEAKAIEELRKNIIEVSGKEEPYDIFICYKETADSGERTLDSVLAQDIYTALTDKGYRVFFSRITLEDKLGQEYEPYIFAALHSAKVMLAVGTDYEYYNAVWVKNEWSRFLALIAGGEKKTLIPCYKGIDAYDMPKEFARLQAQDLGKVGATQDLLRGVEKLLPLKNDAPQPQPQVIAVPASGPNAAALLKRGSVALEDGEWQNADQYFDKVLDMDADSAEAYLGRFLAEQQKVNITVSGAWLYENRENKSLTRAIRYASPELKKTLDEVMKLSEEIVRNEEEARRQAEEEARRKAEEERRQNREKLATIRKRLLPASPLLAAGGAHTAGLRSDGTAVAVGDNKDDQCNVSGWRNIAAIAAGNCHTVGLRADGTVVATVFNGKQEDNHGQCEVSGWTNIVAIAAGNYHAVGLRADGTVVAVGDNKDGQCNVSGWTNIVAIAAGGYHTVGLRADGTVVAVGANSYGQCNVFGWTDIVAIAAGGYHTVGLRADGTVVATKYTGGQRYYNGQCNVSGWTNIVAIAAGFFHTVGLRKDGTVVAAGSNFNEQCNVSDWTDIVAIAAGGNHTVGLRADGTVVAVGKNDDGQCKISDWRLFQSIDTLEQEQKEGMEQQSKLQKAKEAQAVQEAQKAQKAIEAKITALQVKKAALSQELANLKGLLAGLQRKKLETRLAEIDNELRSYETQSIK